MSLLLQFSLIGNVIFGLVGVAALYAVWMSVLKKQPSLGFLKYTSLIGLLSILVSWFSGGYYYIAYYGSVVQPVIEAGSYPWAHLIIAETKEHVFLMLPFASAILVLVFWFLGDKLLTDSRLKGATAWLAATATIIGILTTIAWIVITGSAQ